MLRCSIVYAVISLGWAIRYSQKELSNVAKDKMLGTIIFFCPFALYTVVDAFFATTEIIGEQFHVVFSGCNLKGTILPWEWPIISWDSE